MSVVWLGLVYELNCGVVRIIDWLGSVGELLGLGRCESGRVDVGL